MSHCSKDTINMIPWFLTSTFTCIR